MGEADGVALGDAFSPLPEFSPVTVTALDSLPILPDLAKDLNLPRTRRWRFPGTPLIFLFDQAVSVRGQDSVMGRLLFIALVRVLLILLILGILFLVLLIRLSLIILRLLLILLLLVLVLILVLLLFVL